MPKKTENRLTPDVTAQAIGDFLPDGRLDRSRPRPPKGDRDSCLFWFIDSLVTKRRRCPDVPPREFALHLAKSRFAKAFPTAHKWVPLVQATNWPMIVPGSDAEATVKYCGWLSGEWDGGAFTTEKQQVHARVPASEVAAMVQSVVDPIGETG